MAYLAMMAIRLLEIRRILKLHGSGYLHCDPTASHYLKILLDGVFGKENFLAEIVWKRTNARGTGGRWPRVHDVIFHFRASDAHEHRPTLVQADPAKLPHTLITGTDGLKYQTYELTGAGVSLGETGKPWRGFDPNKYGRHWSTGADALNELDAQGLIHWPENKGFPRRKSDKPFIHADRFVTVGDVWTDIDRINQSARERLGYPTQKPLALLERIVAASSNPGDVVLDPFCGCGTAVHAAEKLGRQWIGIDITHLAISLIEKRLTDAFPQIVFEVIGTPKDLASAQDLAKRDAYQFQWWAVSLVNAVPYGGKKKGADSGIDGLIFFKVDNRTTEKAIVSVKGGANVTVSMVRDLAAVVEREGAKMGLFITLAEPTKPMVTEAVKAGFYETWMGKFPKLQIATVQDLLAGRKPQLPILDVEAFKRAPREKVKEGEQGSLL